MISYKLIFKDRYHIDWDYVENLEEFKDLKNAQQNPKWHSEGNAFIHTQKVVSSMEDTLDFMEYKGGDYDNMTLEHKKMLMASALFHDIGKGKCTFMKDGNWHSYNHENVGASMLSEILIDIDDDTKSKIISLVRNHMKPLQIIGTKNFHKKMKEMASEVNLYDLYYLKTSDINGSEQLNGGTKREDIIKMCVFKSEIPKVYESILNFDSEKEIQSKINSIAFEVKKYTTAIEVVSKYNYDSVLKDLINDKEQLIFKIYELSHSNSKCSHDFEDCGPDDRLFGIYNVRRCKKCGFKTVEEQ